MSGIIASQDIDRWSGFLRSYSRQYAELIPLRSLVKLVQENGQVVDLKADFSDGIEPFLAALDPNTKEPVEERQRKVLELARALKAQDGFPTSQAVQKTSDRVSRGKTPKQQSSVRKEDVTPLQKATQRLLSSIRLIPNSDDTPAPEAAQPNSEETEDSKTIPSSAGNFTVSLNNEKNISTDKSEYQLKRISLQDPELNDAAEVVFLAWMNVAETKVIPEALKKQFLPLLISPQTKGPQCSDRLAVPIQQIPVTVLWLDILSGSESLALTSFPKERQQFILEAAINPAATRDCLIKAEKENGIDLIPYSNFIRESLRNPEFISFLTRDLADPSVTISGASLIGERYIQSNANKRYKAGQSIDQSSRLVAIGELGALIREYDGYTVALYGDTTAWVVRQANDPR